jgi:GTP-binding protein
VSKDPGKTNLLHFIYLENAQFCVVDCPGYGYAKRSKKERQDWNTMMQKYISDSLLFDIIIIIYFSLKRMLILIDTDVGVSEIDKDCMKMCGFSQKEFTVYF